MSVLTLRDYERIFRVIHGLLLNEVGDPSAACSYFGIIGSELLKKRHGMRAVPVFGAAAYRLPMDGADVIAFGSPTQEGVVSNDKAFHCWVEAGDKIIDFQAPLFQEQVERQRPGATFPARMLQRSKAAGRPFSEVFGLSASHAHLPNDSLSRELTNAFYGLRANEDLVTIACDWYRRSPRKIQAALSIGNQKGEVREVPLSRVRVTSAW